MRPELELLLESARSEAKRWDARELNLVHLASAVAKRAPEQFSARFGEDGTGRLRAAIADGVSVGDEAEVVALLERADGPDALSNVVHELYSRLNDVLASSATPPAPDAAGTSAGVPEPATGDDVGPPQAWAPSDRTARFLEVLGSGPPVQGRESSVDELIALLGRRNPATPLIVGRTGSGRTALLRGLAARLADPSYAGPLAGTPVVRVLPGAILAADRSNALRRVFEDLDGSAITAIDDLEVVAAFGGPSGDLDLLAVIRGALERSDSRFVVTIDSAFLPRLEVLDRELAGKLSVVEMPPLPRALLADLAHVQGAELAAHHAVSLSEDLLPVALAPSGSNDYSDHPGLLIERIDGACARAALRPDRSVVERDFRLDRSPELSIPNAGLLSDRMQARLLGQDAALQQVARRLTLTRAQLDLRPARPDGVFLFVGPTGVGKTELARVVCSELYGDEERLIRLDMSEYSEQWALSRLIGPQPGYVGFTEPESWLTTRVRKQPETLVLLDEIEKAHPSVWNAFLQVFDVGRLSDARGNVADFSRAVIVMTSNLGARAFAAPAIGFGRGTDPKDEEESRVRDGVRDALPPELINRIDEIAVFRPLSTEAIEQIARKEVTEVVDRLAARGFDITVEDEVVKLLAHTGYDRAYGARHLQRNVERLLLQPLAGVTERRLSAHVDDNVIVWTPNHVA